MNVKGSEFLKVRIYSVFEKVTKLKSAFYFESSQWLQGDPNQNNQFQFHYQFGKFKMGLRMRNEKIGNSDLGHTIVFLYLEK